MAPGYRSRNRGRQAFAANGGSELIETDCNQSQASAPHTGTKKAGRKSCPPRPRPVTFAGPLSVFLVAGSGCAGVRLRIRLRNAHVSADLVLTHFVDDQLFGQPRAGNVEENRLVERAILLLEALVFHRHCDAVLIALLIHALQFHGHVPDLLRLVLAAYGELDVVALTQPA